MKKVILGTILLGLTIAFPVTAPAAVDVHIGIALPPLVAFPAPPSVIVLPDTDDVYAVPDIDLELFFWNGWWWRPWEGRWYRSRYYDRGWVYYQTVPRFYFDVDPGWRGFYRSRNWHGHHWGYEPIPTPRLQRNWKSWRDKRHWERKRTWDVQNYQPRPKPQRQELRQRRQEEYRLRPEVQRHQQQMQERRPAATPPQRQMQQRQEQRPPAPQRGQGPRESAQQPPRRDQRPPVSRPEPQQQERQQSSQPRGRQPHREPGEDSEQRRR